MIRYKRCTCCDRCSACTAAQEVTYCTNTQQVVQEALIKAGVAERIQQRGNSKLAHRQGAADEGTASSPKSTITFTRTENDAAADQQGTLSTAGGNKHKAAVHINEGAHDMGVSCPVRDVMAVLAVPSASVRAASRHQILQLSQQQGGTSLHLYSRSGQALARFVTL